MVRVLQIFTTLDRGGAETMIMNYYRNVDRSKIQFDFVVHRSEKGDYEEEVNAMGGKIFRFSPIHPQNFSKYKKQVREFLIKHPGYKIIHGHTSELGYFFYKEASRFKIPVIIGHAHNSGMDWDLKVPFRLFFRKYSRSYLTHYFTCGEEAALWFFGKKLLPRVTKLNNAIDTEKFRFKTGNTEKNKFIIGNVARFSKQKNHNFLIDIFNEVYKKDTNCLLILVGDGELRLETEKKVKDLNLENSVYFLGVREDIPELMQSFDLILFPSFYEGFSVVMVEAQASGLKCILSDKIPKETTILPDLVDFISLKETPSRWAEKILAYKNGYGRKDRMLEIQNAGYDIKTNAVQLQNFYLNVHG